MAIILRCNNVNPICHRVRERGERKGGGWGRWRNKSMREEMIGHTVRERDESAAVIRFPPLHPNRLPCCFTAPRWPQRVPVMLLPNVTYVTYVTYRTFKTLRNFGDLHGMQTPGLLGQGPLRPPPGLDFSLSSYYVILHFVSLSHSRLKVQEKSSMRTALNHTKKEENVFCVLSYFNLCNVMYVT